MTPTRTVHPVSPEELMAHFDGELPPDRATFVALHMAACADCFNLSDRFRQSARNLRPWEVGEASHALTEDVLSATAADRSDARARIYKIQLFFSRPLPWVAACLFVVALIIGRTASMRPLAESTLDRSRATKVVAEPLGHSPMGNGQAAGGGGGTRVSGKLATSEDETTNLHRAQVSELQGRAGYVAALPEVEVPPAPPPPPLASGGRVVHEQEAVAPMIARTAELRVVVPKFESARGNLDAILLRYHAYAATLQVNTTDASPRVITASLRVPAAQLGSAMADLKGLGRVESESQSGEEVTEQHADLVARLKNSRETELRLQDILRTRTGKVKDVLEVEEEISRVRGEIEQMEAERKTLEHRVDFATLNLTLAEEFKAQLSSPAPSLGTQWRNSMVTGFRNAFGSFFSLILFLSEIAPALILWLALLFPVAWFLWRRFRATRAALS